MFTGAQRGPSTTLLPALLEALGLLPDPGGVVRLNRPVFVHFCWDRGQLLLHTLAVAHPGGELRCVTAATKEEKQGEVWLEQWLDPELELETPGLWIHSLWRQQRRTLHCHIVGQEMLCLGSGCLTPLDLHEHLIPAGVDILQKSFQAMYFKNQSGPIFSWVRRFLIHNCIKLSLKQNMHKHIWNLHSGLFDQRFIAPA